MKGQVEHQIWVEGVSKIDSARGIIELETWGPDGQCNSRGIRA